MNRERRCARTGCLQLLKKQTHQFSDQVGTITSPKYVEQLKASKLRKGDLGCPVACGLGGTRRISRRQPHQEAKHFRLSPKPIAPRGLLALTDGANIKPVSNEPGVTVRIGPSLQRTKGPVNRNGTPFSGLPSTHPDDRF